MQSVTVSLQVSNLYTNLAPKKQSIAVAENKYRSIKTRVTCDGSIGIKDPRKFSQVSWDTLEIGLLMKTKVIMQEAYSRTVKACCWRMHANQVIYADVGN